MNRRQSVTFTRFVTRLIAGMGLTASLTASAADFFFKDGDRVVMMGDSITEQYLYSSYVENWTLMRFPAWKITFLNVGIGGDRAPIGSSRFKRDVLLYQPTVMTVDFGMNDGGYAPYQEPGFNCYVGGLQGIADQARAAGIRVAWLTTTPLEGFDPGPALTGYNDTLEKYSAGVKQVAEKQGELFIDQFHPFIALIDKVRADDPKGRVSGDPVHPAEPGQSVMAWTILKGMNFPPLVASVELDARAGTVMKSQNCTVDGMTRGLGGTLSFRQLDKALPYCPEGAAKVAKWVPILEDLNDYRLRVTGLRDGQYEIRLNGTNVAQHSAAELSKGVNLASAVLAQGPIAEQVKAVERAIAIKNEVFHKRIFREIALAPIEIPPFLGIKIEPDVWEAKRIAAILEQMKTQMPELFNAIDKARVMQSHQVEIIPLAVLK